MAVSPEAAAYFTADGGRWRATSWQDLSKNVGALAAGLAELGLDRGDRIAVLAPTSLAWECCQLAAMSLGACVVGVDPLYPRDLVDALLNELDVRVLVVGNPSLLEHVSPSVRAPMRATILLEGSGTETVAYSTLSRRRAAMSLVCEPTDPALVAFSSGTSGRPKAITYTHQQVTLACDAILDRFSDIGEGSTLVCWLPLANLFQRMVNFCSIARGGRSYMVSDPRQVVQVAREVEPDVLIAVPRFCEKLWRGMEDKLANSPWWAREPARRAIDASLALARLELRGSRVPVSVRMRGELARRTLLRFLRSVLGSRLRYIISGSAPCPIWIHERFAALGIPIYEAYGQSENAVPIAANSPRAFHLGSVGKPLKHNHVRISREGEVQVKGPGVFAPDVAGNERYRDSLTNDGFLATGDQGEWQSGGFLRLTGRKGEMFKGPNGRWVAPAVIEGTLRQVPGVEQAVVFGRGAIVGVIVVGDDAPKITGLRQELLGVMSDLPSGTRPQGLLVTKRALTIEGGEITTNLKLRRDAVLRRHAAALDRLCEGIVPSTELELVME